MVKVIKEGKENLEGAIIYKLLVGSLNRCISEGIADSDSPLGSIAKIKDENKFIIMIKRRPNANISIPASTLAIRRVLMLVSDKKPVVINVSKHEFKSECEFDDFLATLINVIETTLPDKVYSTTRILVSGNIDYDDDEL